MAPLCYGEQVTILFGVRSAEAGRPGDIAPPEPQYDPALARATGAGNGAAAGAAAGAASALSAAAEEDRLFCPRAVQNYFQAVCAALQEDTPLLPARGVASRGCLGSHFAAWVQTQSYGAFPVEPALFPRALQDYAKSTASKNFIRDDIRSVISPMACCSAGVPSRVGDARRGHRSHGGARNARARNARARNARARNARTLSACTLNARACNARARNARIPNARARNARARNARARNARIPNARARNARTLDARTQTTLTHFSLMVRLASFYEEGEGEPNDGQGGVRWVGMRVTGAFDADGTSARLLPYHADWEAAVQAMNLQVLLEPLAPAGPSTNTA